MDTNTRLSWLPATLALVGSLSLTANGLLDVLGIEIARVWVTVAAYTASASAMVAGFVLMMVGRAQASAAIVAVGESVVDAIEALPSDAPASGDSTVRVTGGRE